MDKPAGTVTFSKAELAAMDGSSGIDMERKESYLGAGEFVEVFGMERNRVRRDAAVEEAGCEEEGGAVLMIGGRLMTGVHTKHGTF